MGVGQIVGSETSSAWAGSLSHLLQFFMNQFAHSLVAETRTDFVNHAVDLPLFVCFE